MFMPPDSTSRSGRRPFVEAAPFPWRCRHCGETRVVPAVCDFPAEVRHDGRLHSFLVPHLEAPTCQACGEKVFTEQVDTLILDALRIYLNLLTPAQIRAGLERVGMTQKEAAQRLGIAEETLSRWLNALQIQSRAMDNLLRAFFAFPQLRTALSGTGQDPSLGLTDAAS